MSNYYRTCPSCHRLNGDEEGGKGYTLADIEHRSTNEQKLVYDCSNCHTWWIGIPATSQIIVFYGADWKLLRTVP